MDTVVILTPVKNAAAHLDTYFAGLGTLTYPRELLSLGMLESDSTDGTYELLQRRLERHPFRAARLFRRDFGFTLPPGQPRWAPALQVQRRTVLARSRNHLLFRALRMTRALIIGTMKRSLEAAQVKGLPWPTGATTATRSSSTRHIAKQYEPVAVDIEKQRRHARFAAISMPKRIS